MTETLYNVLQRASIRAETYDGHSSIELDIFHDVVSEDSRRELKEIEGRELNRLKKRIIEGHADRHKSVASVVDGNATFYSYGEPIIEQVKKVEEDYKDKKFGFIRKSALLGNNLEYSRDAQEAVQYLMREEIINPNKFFRSRLILPRNVRERIGKWNGLFKSDDGKDRIEVAIGTMFVTGVACAGIGYLNYGVVGGFGGFLGGYGLAFGAIVPPSGLEDDPLDRISKQRLNFEQALNTLDSEVKEHFPLDSKLRVVWAT